jgi:hypothetical protein
VVRGSVLVWDLDVVLVFVEDALERYGGVGVRRAE